MTNSETTFRGATLSLRPPRVAVLFPVDEHWRDWAMRALEFASEYWGGGGFILVPHDMATGEPSPKFAEIVRAYDPDHVVSMKIPAHEFESWYPGSISTPDEMSGEERATLIQSIRESIPAAPSVRARDIVASWCSPLRSSLVQRGQTARAHEIHKSLRAVDRGDRFHRGLAVAPVPDTQVLAASSRWRSDLGLMLAARAGVVDDAVQPRAEPASDVIEWAIQREGTAPASLIYPSEDSRVQADEISTRFDVHPGLLHVSQGMSQDMAAVVVGDTGADFALALAYDRILGRGFWVTSRMLDDEDALWQLRSALWWVTSQLEQQAAHLTVSSHSLPDEAVAETAARLQEPNYEFQRLGRRREAVQDSDTVQLRPPQIDRSYTQLVAEEHLSSSILLPMQATSDGTLESVNGLDCPVPTSLMYPVSSGKVPYWYVDVTFAGDVAPRGRDLPATSLHALDVGAFPEVAMRASKIGVTFNPASMGLVMGNSLLRGRLGRPRLRSLSMRRWVEGMVRPEGLGVRLSQPGRQAELVARRLGARDRLMDVITPTTLPLLRAFIRHETTPKAHEAGVVVVALDPYLTFAKMSALVGSAEQVVSLVDTLASSRLLRRGLVLQCNDCRRTSFVDADRIGQEYECPQCAATNPMVSARWREGAEPAWYYDLFTPFRDLLKEHGDIPLLAAAELRRESRVYADVPELEFFDLETNRAVAEIDLIASVDNEVVVVEAKSSGHFAKRSRGTQTKKILRIARALRADRVILATSEPEWNATDLAHVEREAAKLTPFPATAISMTNLGRV
ncbi:hypothetical protein [Microbacterium hydrocarbonoxydans]|uniref:hypothetical protein n=1 Tax=Microbacterium hydrocarbonoxydans TaxID=273678 RepID=UPI0013DB8D3C|nr:hypothetical protein [Microbacterium hydrocarbonoxydans]